MTVADHFVQHPYLMHVVLWLSMLHKRVMDQNKVTSEELRHSQRAIALFNQIISNPIPNSGRDAVFATATLMNSIFFASIDVWDPAASWPMKSTKTLQWLRLQAGVALTIQVANPNRLGGIFAELFQYVERDTDCLVPAVLQNLFKTRMDSPYLRSVQLLAPLLTLKCTVENVMYYLPFIGRMSIDLIELLERRDEQALLLLGMWYSLVAESNQWWLAKRAKVELAAIELFLTCRGALIPADVFLLISRSVPQIEGDPPRGSQEVTIASNI